MNRDYLKELLNIFIDLSPENQAYFLTLVRVAAVAEKNVKEKNKSA